MEKIIETRFSKLSQAVKSGPSVCKQVHWNAGVLLYKHPLWPLLNYSP